MIHAQCNVVEKLFYLLLLLLLPLPSLVFKAEGVEVVVSGDEVVLDLVLATASFASPAGAPSSESPPATPEIPPTTGARDSSPARSQSPLAPVVSDLAPGSLTTLFFPPPKPTLPPASSPAPARSSQANVAPPPPIQNQSGSLASSPPPSLSVVSPAPPIVGAGTPPPDPLPASSAPPPAPPPTIRNVSPPAAPPTSLPVAPSASLPVAPSAPPTSLPVAPSTSLPAAPPTSLPVAPSTSLPGAPSAPPTSLPVAPPTSVPSPPETSSPSGTLSPSPSSSPPTSPSTLTPLLPSPPPPLASAPPPVISPSPPPPNPSPDPSPSTGDTIPSPVSSLSPVPASAPDASPPSPVSSTPSGVTPASPPALPWASSPSPPSSAAPPSSPPSARAPPPSAAAAPAPALENVSVPVASSPRAFNFSAPTAAPVAFNLSASPSPSLELSNSPVTRENSTKAPAAPPPKTRKSLAPSSLASAPVTSPVSSKTPRPASSSASLNTKAPAPSPFVTTPLFPKNVTAAARPPSPASVASQTSANPPVISPSPTTTRLVQPPAMVFPAPPNAGCNRICTDSTVTTLPGTPCSCVIPMRVGLELEIPISAFLSLVSELAKDLSSGTSVKQNQVQIVGASATGVDFEFTEVRTNLVPLHNSFSNTTAFFIAQRLWLHRVPINEALFVNYTVLYVIYPGLPEFSTQTTIGTNIFPPSYNPQQPLGVDIHSRSGHKLQPRLIAIIALGCIIASIAAVGISWFVFCRRNRYRSHTQLMHATVLDSSTTKRSTTLLSSSSPDSALSLGSSYVPGSVRTFNLPEMSKATESFNPSRVIGEGGFGRVYSGVLEDGTRVAAKVLIREARQGDREFAAEVEMLSRLHHRNLVKLVGICTDDDMRCLVYELIPNGSVESHLHGEDKELSPLRWEDRLKIALGAARGLAYLHEDSYPRVIHRDFKSSNILLEHDFTPKVSDFGLAKTASEELTGHISTRVMGTFGYVAPEYAMTGHLLVKSDVYSYGVVLLELLSGRRPVDMSRSPGQENLVTWARPLLTSSEGLELLIDPSLRNSEVSTDNLARVAAIAAMCVHPEVAQRPFMGEVVQALKLVWDELFDGDEGEISSPQQEFRFPESRVQGFFHHRSSSDIVSSVSEDYERPLSAPVGFDSTQSTPGTEMMKKKMYKASGKQAGSLSENGRLDRYRESKLWT